MKSKLTRKRPGKNRLAKFDDFRVDSGSGFELKRHRADETLGLKKDSGHRASHEGNVARLSALHDVLYAERKHALLIVLQGMDAAGKDGTIKHVMSGVNPQGCAVTAFKQPTPLELDHDFLWRIHAAVPPKGSIGIFNRSQYEDVLIARVHNLVPRRQIEQRCEEINNFEKMLAGNGVVILKFFLHISREEQARRFEARLTDPLKGWKASTADFRERKYWDDYQTAYEDAIRRCSTKHAPWYVIPSDHKWFRNYAVSGIVIRALESLRMKYPEASAIVKSSKFSAGG